jgi:anti-sigma B factor antagonist
VSDNGDQANQQLFASMSLERDVLSVRLVGPSVGGREAPILSKMIQGRINEVAGDLRYVVLDFSDVTFVNSSGLGACIEIHNLARSRKADVVLYGMREDLRTLFKITRLDKLFKVVDDEQKLEKLVS